MGAVHSKPNPTVNERQLEHFCGRNQNTPAGGSSGKHPDLGSFQHRRSCTFSKRLVANGVFCFQLFDIDGVSSDFEVFSDVRFDNKGRARATRMNGCQLKLHQSRVYVLVGIYSMDSKLGGGAMNVQLRCQLC